MGLANSAQRQDALQEENVHLTFSMHVEAPHGASLHLND